MKIQLALLASCFVYCVWSEYTDLYGEDLIDPSDMLNYDAPSQSMRDSKQRKVNGMLKQHLLKTLKHTEELGQTTDENEDVQYQAKITFNRQILQDFLKCIAKHDCEPTIFEQHLQNINTKLKIDNESEDPFPVIFDKILKTTTDEDVRYLAVITFRYKILKDFLKCMKKSDCEPNACEKHLEDFGIRLNIDDELEDDLPMVFDKVLEVAIFCYILIGFLDLVKEYALLEWLLAHVGQRYWMFDCKGITFLVQECFKWIFHKTQLLQEEHHQEQNDADVNDKDPGVGLNPELCRSQSPDSPKQNSESSNDGLKNRNLLLKQPNIHEDSKGSLSTTSVCEWLDNDNQQGHEDLSDSIRKTFIDIYCGEEETSASESFMIIEEEEESKK